MTKKKKAVDKARASRDPFGGQRDLEQRVLRHVFDAFVEDPVRVLRVARFMARFAPGFSGTGKRTRTVSFR